jgi:ABC-type branched-subunit amino acid transport system substrate-binding protein
MKKIHIILILFVIVSLWACEPKRIPISVVPDSQLFSKAESLFQKQFYEESLAVFEEYLLQFPDTPLADEALMKMGTIHAILGDGKNAVEIYTRLIDEYPESDFIPDANFQMLSTLYNLGEYLEVIERATDFLKYTVSSVHMLRTHMLLGDTYMAIGIPTDAVYWYAKAFNKLKEPEKRDVITKIKGAVGQLSSEEILFIIDRVEDKPTVGYLIYQLGVNNAEEEKYEEALKVLSTLVEKLPEHEFAQQAKNLIAEIKKKFAYNRFTIGCLLPLSGPYKIYGKKALRGVELALNHYSSQNIVPLRVIIKDTGSDSVKATQAVIELYDEGVAAIIGPIVTAEPAAYASQDRGIPIITLTQKEDITDIGDYVFRNFFTPKTQVKASISYVVKELGLNRFAILYPDENYGTTFMNLFWDEVTAHGAKVVGIESYDSTITDFADQIKKLVGLYYPVPKDLRDVTTRPDPEEPEEPEEPIVDFDAIFIPDAPKTAGLIIPQLAYHDIKDTYLLGTNLWHSETLIKMARRFVQGALMPDGFFAESASVHVKEFVKMFQESFDQKPEFIEAVAYDTAMILFQLVDRPDVRFRSTLNKELRKLKNFRGVTALTSFDDNGDALAKLYLLRIEGEQFVEVEQR